MEKDFCSKLLPNFINNFDQNDVDARISDSESHLNQSRYQITENVIKLNFKYPINIELSNNEINCTTQKYNSDNFTLKNSPLIPFYFDDISSSFQKSKSNIPIYKNDYIVHCKNQSGIFLPEYLCNGSRGNCIYLLDENLRLTPVQFQNYAGSTSSDWKDVIKIYNYELSQHSYLRKNRMNRMSKLCSIKNLHKNNFLVVHEPICECKNGIDTKSDYLKNRNLISSIFLNSYSNYLFLRSNITESNYLEIDLFERHKKPKSKDINFLKYYFNTGQKLKIQDNDNYELYDIDIRTFDEDNYFTNQTSNSINDAYLNLNYENKCFKTIYLNLNQEEKKIEIKYLNQIEFDKQLIKSIAGSNLIRGECSILTHDGNIFLTDETTSNEYNMKKIAYNVQEKFVAGSNFRKINIGAHPRLFVYSDYSQILTIDSRIKTTLNLISKEIFSPNSKYLEQNELICHTDIIKNDYNHHLISCSKNLLLIDERYSKQPLLQWKHFMRSESQYLANTNLNLERNLIFCSDSNNIFVYNYSNKTDGIPKAYEFDKKLDRPIDIINNNYLPNSYDKRLDKFLQNKLNKPILSLNLLRYHNSCALFQLLDNQDLYYQTFKLCDVDKKKEASKQYELEIYENWINILKNVVLKDDKLHVNEASINDSETDENEEKYCELVENSIYKRFVKMDKKNCQICNISSINGLSEECSRCSKKKKKKNLNKSDLDRNMRVLNKIDLQYFEQNSNKFTKKLLNLWND